jgi:hypothetical protein
LSLSENTDQQNYAADYLRLKALNDELRERGKLWLWSTLERLCAEVNQQLTAQPDSQLLQTGSQPWQFEIQTELGQAIMAGERYGIRYRGQTLVVEVGWPQLPEHGFIPNRGLARGRVRFSPNVMLEPQTKAELALKRTGDELTWHVLNHKQLGPPVTAQQLRNYLDLVLKV